MILFVEDNNVWAKHVTIVTNNNDADNSSDESNEEDNVVQCSKVIIRGVEVDVPLPQNKKKR